MLLFKVSVAKKPFKMISVSISLLAIQIILVSRIMVCVYGCLSGVLAIILLQLGLNLGWVYLAMGIIIGSAVFPIAASITWKKCSAFAAITSALVTLPLFRSDLAGHRLHDVW